MTALWQVPPHLLAIIGAWLIDEAALGTDYDFYMTYLYIFAGTATLQFAASFIIWKVENIPPINTHREIKIRFTTILDPFRSPQYRQVLVAIFMMGIMMAMITSFINPYLIQALAFKTLTITLIDALVFGAMLGFIPIWGKLVDRFGGRNMLRVAVLGSALGIFSLVINHPVFFILFVLFVWSGIGGFFGSGITISQQYLILSLSDPDKSNIYIAASMFMIGIGGFIGSISGGILLEWLKDRMNPTMLFEHYRIYFTYCALGFLLIGGFITTLQDGKQKISYSTFVQELVIMLRRLVGK